MPFDQLEQLSDLVGLCLALHFLEVQKLGDVSMHKDVVASFRSRDPKAECFGQREEVAKPHVVWGDNNPPEKLSRPHPTRNPRNLTDLPPSVAAAARAYRYSSLGGRASLL